MEEITAEKPNDVDDGECSLYGRCEPVSIDPDFH